MSVLLFAVEDQGPRALEVPAGVSGFDGLFAGLQLGVYEALRTYRHNRFLELDEHIQRLKRSMARLDFDLDLDEKRMRASLHEVCSDAPFANMRVRFDVLAAPATERGTATRELLSVVDFEPPPAALYATGVSVTTTNAITRQDPLAKTAAFVETRRRIERDSQDYERLIVEPSGSILEGFSSNFYAVSDGVLMTAGEGVLEGVTRRIILSQAARLGITVCLQAPHQAELTRMHEAAISSSSRGLVPVVEIDGEPVGTGEPGPIITTLITAYDQHVARSIERAV
jgi:branched-chain amino acid aminotransferase